MRSRGLKPLIVFESYLLSTIFLFEFGPIKFPTQNKGKLYFFLFIYHLFFILGYIILPRIFKFKDNKSMALINNIFYRNKNRIIKIMLLLTIFFSIMSIIRIAGSDGLGNIINRITYSFSNLGDVYNKNMQSNYSGGIVTISSTILSGFYYMGIPLAVYFYKDLNWSNKILCQISIFLEGISYIIKGTNIGIFNLVSIIVPIMIIKHSFNFKGFKIRFKKIFTYIILPTIFIIYFFNTTSSRMQGSSYLPVTIFNIDIDYTNFIFKLIPEKIWFGAIMIISYISQGYYGMSLAFNYSFNSTFGIGSGYFLIENFKELLNIDIFSYTYQFKMAAYWDPRVNWHTAYTWFANDISFYGVIFIMILLGAFTYYIINDAKKGNIFAISLLPLYIIMIMFLPANNVVISTPTFFMPFILINILWIINKNLVLIRRI